MGLFNRKWVSLQQDLGASFIQWPPAMVCKLEGEFVRLISLPHVGINRLYILIYWESIVCHTVDAHILAAQQPDGDSLYVFVVSRDIKTRFHDIMRGRFNRSKRGTHVEWNAVDEHNKRYYGHWWYWWQQGLLLSAAADNDDGDDSILIIVVTITILIITIMIFF